MYLAHVYRTLYCMPLPVYYYHLYIVVTSVTYMDPLLPCFYFGYLQLVCLFLNVRRQISNNKYCDICCDLRIKNDVRVVFAPICFVGGSCFIYCICIYLHILVSKTISIPDDELKTGRRYNG